MSELKWQIDHDDARFLDSIRYYGGEAAMHKIRGRTGLSRGKANHRFNKLENLGLIDITYQPYKSQEEKVAHLTGDAKYEIERGLLDGLAQSPDDDDTSDVLSEVKALREDVQQAEHRINVLNATIEELRTDIDGLQDYVFDWTEFAEKYLLAIRGVLESSVDGLDDFNDCLRDYD